MKNKYLKDVFGFSLICLCLGSGFYLGDYISRSNLETEKQQWVAHRLAYQEMLGIQPGEYLQRTINRNKTNNKKETN